MMKREEYIEKEVSKDERKKLNKWNKLGLRPTLFSQIVSEK